MAKTNPPPAGGSTAGNEQARRASQQCHARGSEVFKTGQYDYAIKLFKDACKLAPDQIIYRQHLRMAGKKKFDNNKKGSRLAAVTTIRARASLKTAKMKKDYHRALEACEDILSANPWDTGTLLEMADIFDRLELLDIAIWTAEGALEKDPNDATVNRALAQLYEKRGAFTKAINSWERVKKAKPEDEEADKKMKDLAASATIDRGGYAGAESFTRAIADKSKTQELLDETKGGTNESRQAQQISELEQRVRNSPGDVPPYLQLSQLLRRQGKLEQAQAVMAKGLAATGGHPDAQNELAEIEIERLKHDLAVARKLAAERPNDAPAQKKVGELARTLNDFELREYQRRTERNPTDLSLRLQLGIRLAKAGRFDEAIGELQKAKNDPRRKGEVLFWIGRAFHAKKNTRMAKRHYEEALESLPQGEEETFKELHYLLGRLCDEMGDKPAAVQHYEEVAAVNYGYRDVAKRLEALAGGDQGTATSAAQDTAADESGAGHDQTMP